MWEKPYCILLSHAKRNAIDLNMYVNVGHGYSSVTKTESGVHENISISCTLNPVLVIVLIGYNYVTWPAGYLRSHIPVAAVPLDAWCSAKPRASLGDVFNASGVFSLADILSRVTHSHPYSCMSNKR
jgi:hypothetical protein